MRKLVAFAALAAALLAAGPGFAQQPTPQAYPLDAIPDKLPNATP